MPAFKKKPVVIEAFQLPQAGAGLEDEGVQKFLDWADSVGFHNWDSSRDESLEIQTLEGVMRADPGDWIIKGVNGEFYPCKPDIFAKTYHDAKQKSGAEMLRELLGHVEDGSNICVTISQDDATKTFHMTGVDCGEVRWTEYGETFEEVVALAYHHNVEIV